MELKVLLFFAATSWPGWLILFVGIGTILEKRRRQEQEYTRTSGCIVDYASGEQASLKNVAPAYRKPVIEFTAEGHNYRLEYENSLSPQQHPVGEAVEVLYDVSRPTRFHLEADVAFQNGGRNLARVGLVWILICAALDLALAVFVGGMSLDFRHLWHDVERWFARR